MLQVGCLVGFEDSLNLKELFPDLLRQIQAEGHGVDLVNIRRAYRATSNMGHINIQADSPPCVQWGC